MKLYTITEEIKALTLLEDDIDEQTFKDTLEGLTMILEDKANGYAKIIATYKGEVDTIDAEIKRLSAMKSTRNNKIKWLKQNLQEAMTIADNKKFKTDLFSFGIQKNPASLKLNVDFSETKVGEMFLIEQAPKVDSKKIKDILKDGGIVEGARLEQGESLRIK